MEYEVEILDIYISIFFLLLSVFVKIKEMLVEFWYGMLIFQICICKCCSQYEISLFNRNNKINILFNIFDYIAF